jgi:hypothetical protein
VGKQIGQTITKTDWERLISPASTLTETKLCGEKNSLIDKGFAVLYLLFFVFGKRLL